MHWRWGGSSDELTKSERQVLKFKFSIQGNSTFMMVKAKDEKGFGRKFVIERDTMMYEISHKC